jgi:2-haloacid dehalogenase
LLEFAGSNVPAGCRQQKAAPSPGLFGGRDGCTIYAPSRQEVAIMTAIDDVKALLFDVFGTVVDWRTSIIEDLGRFGSERGLTVDWAAFADDWRALYQPAMEEVRAGRRAWTVLDVLHRESLDKLLRKYDVSGLSAADCDHVNRVWHRLKPWPDAVDGLQRLKTRYIIGTLSNGNVGLLTRMAKHAGLPWDVILGAETARAYKPLPQAYLASAELLNLLPAQVMLVAAHNGDLAAAAEAGLRTGFVPRPGELGPNQTRDLKPERDWDVVADSFVSLAKAMGC